MKRIPHVYCRSKIDYPPTPEDEIVKISKLEWIKHILSDMKQILKEHKDLRERFWMIWYYFKHRFF